MERRGHQMLGVAVLVEDESQRSLLERIQQNDKQALADVYDRYFDQIHRYVHYRLNEPDAAADIACDVFLALVSALKKGNPPRTSLSGWLYTVARNLVADHIKKKGKTVPLIDEIVSEERELSERAHWAHLVPKLKASLPKLTQDQQHVIALRFGQGMSLAETAEIMDKSVGSIKALQHRALASLARLMPKGDSS